MDSKIKISLIVVFVLAGLAFALVSWNSLRNGRKLTFPEDTLRVLSYPVFVSSFGPGPELAREFEKRCKCRVELLNAGDSALITQKVLAKGEDFPVDVIIGLDQYTAPEALRKLKWRKVSVDLEVDEVFSQYSLDPLLPFDWGPLSFIYREGEISPPHNFQDLLDFRFQKQVSLQNPKTSTPGLQFFLWIQKLFGPQESLKYLESLSDQDFVFADTWSQSYGLFQRGQVKMGFSYLTSLIYHWENGESQYKAAVFELGHPVQVEWMGVLERCRLCEQAEAFVKFLLEEESQKKIMEKNYMYPVRKSLRQGTLFEQLPDVKLIQTESNPEVWKPWLEEALGAVSL